MIYQCILLFQGTPFNCEISFVTTHIKNRNYYLRKMLHKLWKNYRDTDQQILCSKDFPVIIITIIITITIMFLPPLFCHTRFTFCVTLCKSILIMAFKHLFHKVTYLKLKLQYCKYFKY